MAHWRLDVGFGGVRPFYEVHPATRVDQAGESPAPQSPRAWVVLYGDEARAPVRPYGLTREDDEWIARQWSLTENPGPAPPPKSGGYVAWLAALVLGAMVFCMVVGWFSHPHGFADHRHGPHHGSWEGGATARHFHGDRD